jgi:DNA-binding transcriptional MerR regulator
VNASISQVASQLGVSAHTLRYYERLGLLNTVRKRGGVRTYSPQDIEWLRFLRRLREIGMPMRKIAVYARLRKAGSATLIERRALLQEQLLQLEKQREALSGHQTALLQKLAIYDAQIHAEEKSSHEPKKRHPNRRRGARGRTGSRVVG